MSLPTEPIGSSPIPIPRPSWLLAAIDWAGQHGAPELDEVYDRVIRGETLERIAATGSRVGTAGGRRKCPNFWSYRVRARVEGMEMASSMLGAN